MIYLVCNTDDQVLLFSSLGDKVKITKEFEKLLDPESGIYNEENKIFLFGRGGYDLLRSMDISGKIHLGLRSYDYGTMKTLSILTINKCKLSFSINDDPKDPTNIKKLKELLAYDKEREKYVLEKTDIVTCDEGSEKLKNFNINDEIGFDFESRSFPNQWDFDPVGIGLANTKYGLYIDFRYASSDKVRESFMSDFKDFVNDYQTRLWCFFCQFEVNALKIMFHELYRLNDVMSLTKCDSFNGGLKVAAQHYLHVGSWDDDQDYINVMTDNIYKHYNTFENFKAHYNNQIDEKDKEYKDFLDSHKFDLNMINKYWGNEYASTPTNIVGKYCILDSYYTLMCMYAINNKYHYIGDAR